MIKQGIVWGIVVLLAILLSLGAANAQLMNLVWTKYQQNNNNTGLSPYYSNSNGTLRWNYTVGGIVQTSPVVDSNEIIYVGGGVYLHAVYSNGTTKWNYSNGNTIYTTVALDIDGAAYVGVGGNLLAINPNGTLKWNFTDVGWDTVRSSPAIDSDGIIYFGNNALVCVVVGGVPISGCANLTALYSNGTKKWSYTTTSILLQSSPAIDSDGTIYFGNDASLGDGKLYAINPNGTLKWTYSSIDSSSSPTIGSDGIIYVHSSGNLLAIYPNGTLKWTYSTGFSGTSSSPAINSNGNIIFGSNKVYVVYSNGTPKWNYTTTDYVDSSASIDSGGVIYIGDAIGNFYAINSNGTLKWNYTITNYYSLYSAIGSDGTIYVEFGDDKLYAFAKCSGVCNTYTAKDGSDPSNDCLSWSSTCLNISRAVNLTLNYGTIHIGYGNYSNQMRINGTRSLKYLCDVMGYQEPSFGSKCRFPPFGR